MSAVDFFTAYFDETRVDDASPFPVVAGFCSTYDVWEYFEKKWREASQHIPDHGIKKYFRHRPSEHNSPEDEKRYRDALILAKVIRDFTLWQIHVSIERECFQEMFDAADKSAAPLLSSAYATCSIGCCELLDSCAMRHQWKREHGPIKVVFDDGNGNRRWLEKGYDAYYSQKSGTYLKKRAAFEDDQELIPLRAADAYAWLLGRKYNHGEELDQLKIIHDEASAHRRLEKLVTKSTAKQCLAMINSQNEHTKEKQGK